ncbi:MAG: FAD-dependent oxidoreductase [Lentisphaerae bacterium]|nr:FAD-dependent oxidoreductase [Lentisphaerota bacterium]
MRELKLKSDLLIVGGGLSGVCAALAAARNGIKVTLMHDRPVLGGNASSEIRMWICGARGDDRRESGIVEEILLDNLYRNPERNYSVWDSVMYSLVKKESNITLLLNTVCTEVAMDGEKIASARGYQSPSQTWYTVEADYFADCSGDSILGVLAKAELRYGREERQEFNESIAPETGDKKTMGMSCLFQCRETDEPHDFIAPEWAYRYQDESEFNFRDCELVGLQNFWWIEVGGSADALHDVDESRDELLKIAFGIWDFLKNSPKNRERYRNWTLEWVGFLPGKRESYRYVGDHIMNQNDVAAGGKFDDIIAYGGWPMDDHHPDGFYYPGEPTIFHPAPSPFGIPYRSLYSRNISNLFCAGRNISVTHSALSSTRVMATCGTLGQAAGTACAIAVKNHCSPREVGQKHLDELQNTLMRDDIWLPGKRFAANGLTASAEISCEGLRGGLNRVIDGVDESFTARIGSQAEYRWTAPVKIRNCRFIFDSDLNRKEKNIAVLHWKKMPLLTTPATLVKRFKIEALTDGKWVDAGEFFNPGQRLVNIPLDITCSALRFTVLETYGNETVKIFAWTVA